MNQSIVCAVGLLFEKVHIVIQSQNDCSRDHFDNVYILSILEGMYDFGQWV